jgi:hypothetical protein
MIQNVSTTYSILSPLMPYCSVISENMQYDYLSNSGFVPAVNEFGDQRGIKSQRMLLKELSRCFKNKMHFTRLNSGDH